MPIPHPNLTEMRYDGLHYYCYRMNTIIKK